MKSKRHTEHYSRSTQSSSQCNSIVHWRFTTPLICTKNTHHKLKSVTLSWIQKKKRNQQSDKALLCLVFLWKKCVLCPLLVREERGESVSYKLWRISSTRKTAEPYKPLFPLHHNPPPPLLLHLSFPSSSKCSSIQLPQIILQLL